MAEFEETRFFTVKVEKENETRDIILKVYNALKEKGHNPVSQIAGYLLSGDPTSVSYTHLDVYKRQDLDPLPKPSIDTCMGLERIASVLQGVDSNFDTDLFVPLTEKVREIAGIRPNDSDGVFPSRVIADHIRACTFLAADGVHPSNEGRGYVMRRILRRAVRFGRVLGIKKLFLAQLVPVVTATMGDAYPELREKEEYIQDILAKDEERFLSTLEGGQARAQEMCIRDREGTCVWQ